MEPTEKKSNGALVGVVIIIVILIVGGIYIWQSKVKNAGLKNDAIQSETAATADSQELNALEQELETTNTDVGVDVNSIN